MHKVIGCINAENTCRLAHIGHAFQNATAGTTIDYEGGGSIRDPVRRGSTSNAIPISNQKHVMVLMATVMIVP
jgi:hypothetical protein